MKTIHQFLLVLLLAGAALFAPFYVARSTAVHISAAAPPATQAIVVVVEPTLPKRTLLNALQERDGQFSCDLYENETSLFEPLQWKGMDRLCSHPRMRVGLNMKVNKNYWEHYELYSHRTGIIEEAYVAFVFGPKYSAMMTHVLESASLFSEKPILLFTSQLEKPPEILFPAKMFPRVIVIEMDTQSVVAFWFDKLFAAVIAPVMRGVIIEADSLVTWNTDRLFKILAHYDTYEYPLLPGHPDVRWPNCAEYVGPKECVNALRFPQQNRSMDYAHAHVSWTSASRPFLIKILSQCLHDPSGNNGCEDDEMAVNVAMWAAGATKQYCLTDPFHTAIEDWQIFDGKTLREKYKNRTISFMLIHGCKEPADARQLIMRIHAMKGLPWLFTREGEWVTNPKDFVHDDGVCLN
jgi:hypothetical protein